MDPWTETTYHALRDAIIGSASGGGEALALVDLADRWLVAVKRTANRTTEGYVPDGEPLLTGNSYTWALGDALDAAFLARDSHHAAVVVDTARAVATLAECHADIYRLLPVREVM